MNILNFNSFYLVGIKGVAMASLAQCLLDAGKKVKGCDVKESFVTEGVLDRAGINIEEGFDNPIPSDTECVIYTAAHKGQFNPQVVAAKAQDLPCLSQAEAIANLFNQKQGVAVCGVGGKSTTSAMITWILEKNKVPTSFSVGVGNIPGLNKTGQWSAASQYFVAEADEYVIDPSAPSRGEKITPRFSFMHPFVTVCTNLKFDHPDVYQNFEHTQAIYGTFFSQIKTGGKLIINADDQPLITLAQEVAQAHHLKLLSFGEAPQADIRLLEYRTQPGKTFTTFSYNGTHTLELPIPGKYNALNALAAITAVTALGIPIDQSLKALAEFHSTMRRAEFIGEKAGVKFYDDYAHHPNEVQSVIRAFKEWYPNSRVVIAFQSHTFSRTKALFSDFITAFELADEVAMIDIFASAREPFDSSITSEMLCVEITHAFPKVKAQNYKTLEGLASYLHQSLKSGDVCVTVGAGDIYHVHELI